MRGFRDEVQSEMIGLWGQGKRIEGQGAIILSPQKRKVRKGSVRLKNYFLSSVSNTPLLHHSIYSF